MIGRTDTPTAVRTDYLRSPDDEHVRTEHLRDKIKARTVSGTLITGVAQTGQMALTIGYAAVVARLLTPRDFGLVASAMVIGGFLQIFKDAGLSTATIQRENITNAQVSNLFWINIGVSTTAACVMAAGAPLIASFFRQPELLNISRALSLVFVLDGLSVQHSALLCRQMRFRAVSAIEVASVALGFLVGIAMAMRHWSYWSLVIATLSTALFRVTAVWLSSGWRPQWPRTGTGTRPLITFGADLTLVGFIYAMSRGADNALIGRYLGADAVGLYSRSTALLSKPLDRLIAPVYAVIVPALSRLQGSQERYRSAFLQAFEGLAISGFVFTGLFFPLAHAVVMVVLGPKWEAASSVFAALTFAGLHIPLSTAASWLYTSQGRGRELLVTASIGAVVMVGSFVAGLPFGPVGVAVGYSAAGILISLPLTFYIAGRAGPVGSKDLWLACLRHLPVLVVVMSVTGVTAMLTSDAMPPLQQLLIGLATGLTAAAAGILAFTATRRIVTRLFNALRELRVK